LYSRRGWAIDGMVFKAEAAKLAAFGS